MAYLGESIGKLGFGLMRLPMKGDTIDVEQTKEMVDLFLEAGFTYFDTAWAYAGSEDAIRQALVERYPRESFQLATKNAAWINCKTREEAVAQFDTSLKQTGAGYFDFYLLHNLGEGRTKYFDEYDMWSWVLEKKREGLVKHVGFSFHSTPEELEELLSRHPEMEFVQLQINYATGTIRPCSPGPAMRWPESMASRWSSWSRSRAACWRIRQRPCGKYSGRRSLVPPRVLGHPFCREPGGRDHRAFRHEQRGADEG